ncbi:NAD(P)H-binding protein [uncultured Draconibacterium sp.]|uniref:NAD(P)H-binding protein n=1 Tax=uncultured Draconibacterium sp. TaxID=1573823 RepID=UPI0025D023AA|nr:NAD(P)H-binding protein [uncultured Draconibacterium sp.]
MRKTISILGCGWLGTALGKSLLRQGWKVKGSTTTTQSYNKLELSGISTFYVKVKARSLEVDYNSFFNTDVLVVAFPPTRTRCVEDSFPPKIEQLIAKIKEVGVKKVLFVSSTSVYESVNAEVVEGQEGSPEKTSGKALLAAEQLLLSCSEFKTTVLRFGGLIGYDRNPARFVQNKKEPLFDAPVNLIHRDDCVNIITQILEKNIWGEVFNAVCPEHPGRNEFYARAAKISELPVPVFSKEHGPFKIVNSNKLIQQLQYSFVYNSPMDYLKEVEEWAYRI